MSDTPELTLDPFAQAENPAFAETALAKADPQTDMAEMIQSGLSEEEKKMVTEFAGKINIADTAVVLQYGAGTQQKIAAFSDSALKSVRTQDLGETGDVLAKLVAELKDFDSDIDQAGSRSLFRRTKKKITALKAKYDKVEGSVSNIVDTLDKHQVTLLKDVSVLDELYQTNFTYFKELSMYIAAGKLKLEQERNETLKELREKAEQSGLPEDAQKANDYAGMCDRFERKLHDLELSRAVSIQMAPQIRIVQGNDTLMCQKIQSTIVNTIPLWKSQMIIALGLEHSEQALRAERAVTDMTNDLLKKNAALLHQSTVETAKENERGIVDIETLSQTNRELIATLDEVRQIQSDGKAKRREAEAELGRIEEELKAKLLEYTKPAE
ncbi:MAG: toxic anion resistance protein [Clostridia bacterium]|nr:toxic anion resistance protein [Clostridia bacterium]